MKKIWILSLILVAFSCSLLDAQDDTITMKTDMVLCSFDTDGIYFTPPYDTSEYNFSWYDLDQDSIFSQEDSVFVSNMDTLLLISVPVDTMAEVILDTLCLEVRVYPFIQLIAPPIQCFSGDTLSFKDSTIIYNSFTQVEYTNEINEMLMPVDSILSVFVDNGDTILIKVNYTLEGCADLLHYILLGTKFQPIIDIEANEVCAGDSTTLYNNSEFDVDISDFSLRVEDGIGDFAEPQDSFVVLLPENGDVRDVFIEINQDECITRDTITIFNNINPTAIFEPLATCENELLIINDSSRNVLPVAKYEFDIDGEQFDFDQANSYTIPETFPNNTYLVTGTVDNLNGCTSTTTFMVEIDSVTYVSFSGLDTTFCERQTEVLLIGNIAEGEFVESDVVNIGNGEAIFRPLNEASNFPITFRYTNSEDCTDSETQIIPQIYPKPEMELNGLDENYCHFDSQVVFSLQQQLEETSLFLIRRNDETFDSVFTLDYIFSPENVGFYRVFNFYTDENGCFDSITNFFTVFPRPIISLDSLTIIQPGDEIRLGDDSFFEENVVYSWSNGSTQPFIDVSQPGIYILEAENKVTECMSIDTANIGYDPRIEIDLVEVEIGPNPTSDMVTIRTLPLLSGIRLINVFGERIILKGMSSFSTNSDGELELDLSLQSSGYYYLMIPQLGNFLLVKT
ncbi:MAG: hypothetical protein AAGA77_20290 [Bacteroidota bacterium]